MSSLGSWSEDLLYQIKAAVRPPAAAVFGRQNHHSRRGAGSPHCRMSTEAECPTATSDSMSADPERMRQVDLDEPVTQLIVQFRIHGHGSIRDLDFRHHVEDVLQAALQEDDLGMVDGGDIGSGSVNVFAFVDPDRWEAAWATVRSKLADMELLQRAVVARQVDDSHPEVVWPEGSGQKFRFWEEPHNYLA